MNKNVRQYIKNCRRVFPFFGKKEKQFFYRLKCGVLTYCDSTNLTSYEDIEKEFGTPKDIIESYIKSCDNKYVLKKMQIAAFLKKTLIFFLILITLISIFELYSIYEIMNQKIITEEEIVEIYDE